MRSTHLSQHAALRSPYQQLLAERPQFAEPDRSTIVAADDILGDRRTAVGITTTHNPHLSLPIWNRSRESPAQSGVQSTADTLQFTGRAAAEAVVVGRQAQWDGNSVVTEL